MSLVIPSDSVNIETFDVGELLRLRDRINAKLPSGAIEDINLSSELVLTFRSAKALLESAADDDDTPLSQKSAIVNSLNSLLKNLADLQKSLYSVERQQKLEAALVEALKKFPELISAFFEEYEKEC